MNRWSDGERQTWNEAQRDAVPVTRLLRKSRHVAKRRHRQPCDVCGSAIKPGQQYEAHAFTVDGEFQTVRAHIGCPKRETDA